MNNPEQTDERYGNLLNAALGPVILSALADPAVVEVMVNADGRIWIDRLGQGRSPVGSIHPPQAESVIRLVADRMQEPAGPQRPIISGTLPLGGERFQGQLPPVTAAPVFAIRKRSPVIFTLADYVDQGILTAAQAESLRQAIAHKENLLIAGGTGSGKTTLANALLAEPAFAQDRVLLIEDTRELQCASADCVELLSRRSRPAVTMDDLLRCALRLRPDRIIVGEVRGPEALSLLKAWNTGHPGGLATLHANSAADALSRLEDLIGEASRRIPRRAIARAIHLVVFIRRTPQGRKVGSLCRVKGFDGREYKVEEV